jgi:hypothetical protein
LSACWTPAFLFPVSNPFAHFLGGEREVQTPAVVALVAAGVVGGAGGASGGAAR